MQLSIAETTKANDLNIEKYLVYLMDVFCNFDKKDVVALLRYMPWSKEFPCELKLESKNIHE